MNKTFTRILELLKTDQVKISSHGYDELAEDGILVKDVLANIQDAKILEDYPDYSKGPCVLVLQKDLNGKPIHVVWGISKGTEFPAVLVTAYRPDPQYWSNDLTRRKK